MSLVVDICWYRCQRRDPIRERLVCLDSLIWNLLFVVKKLFVRFIMGLILFFLALRLLACDPVDVDGIKVIIVLLSGYVLVRILCILCPLLQATLLASRL